VPETRIGISGWTYAGWRRNFYPAGLPARKELNYASRQLNSIEINGSFYSLQRPDTYHHWYVETPRDFRFAVKGSRFITHNKKLRNTDAALANFFASGILRLKEKLGPLLWQLPPILKYDEERMEGFFSLLPRTTAEAARLGRTHDYRVEGRSWTKAGRNRAIRHAIEPRHTSFFTESFARLCRRYGIAIVFSDSASWPYTEEVTADFVYLRLHGSQQTYASRYSDSELDEWADRIKAWRRGSQPSDAKTFTHLKPPRRKSRNAYVYFDNDAKVHAPRDAARLAERLGVRWAEGQAEG
jgi:uncharacterized protein YecE (DUF72 family)